MSSKVQFENTSGPPAPWRGDQPYNQLPLLSPGPALESKPVLRAVEETSRLGHQPDRRDPCASQQPLRALRLSYNACARTVPPERTKRPAPRWWMVCNSALSSSNSQCPLAKMRGSAAAATTSAKQVS
jgi:hypothetical protein